MKITHPLRGASPRLDVPAEVEAFVAKLPELPTVERPEWTWKWYAERNIGIEGAKPGVLPARKWTDPDAPESLKALEDLYKHLGGAKLNRSRVAVALNLQSSNDVDRMLGKLAKAGKVGVTITPGARGVARAAVVTDVVKAQAAKQAAKAPAKANGRKSA